MAKYDILLIGDGTNLLKTIGWVLEYKGFAVKLTAGPEAALEALVKKNYDLVVARLAKEDLEGLDILKRAKRLNPEVKVMVVSGNNEAIFPLEAYQLDIDDYILMPVSPTELWRRVSDCLEGREVVDLHPVPVAADNDKDRGQVGPETMLMLHDLRASLVSTASSLKLAARGTYGDVSEGARAKLHAVAGRIDKLIPLMEGFIGKALADHQPGGRQRDVLDLNDDIVEPVLVDLAGDIQDHHITLVNRLHNQSAGRIPVRGSKLWLRSVFRNLINNGIKYGGRGCTIVVDCEMYGSNCRLHVYNTGQTVPEACRSMLFTDSPRMRRSQKSRQGLGLGLSLSRDLLQNFGGDIWYEAKSGGSDFVVSLPQT
jgi:two-component system sensor histidine kinase/response regulator